MHTYIHKMKGRKHEKVDSASLTCGSILVPEIDRVSQDNCGDFRTADSSIGRFQ